MEYPILYRLVLHTSVSESHWNSLYGIGNKVKYLNQGEGGERKPIRYRLALVCVLRLVLHTSVSVSETRWNSLSGTCDEWKWSLEWDTNQGEGRSGSVSAYPLPLRPSPWFVYFDLFFTRQYLEQGIPELPVSGYRTANSLLQGTPEPEV